MEILLTIFSLLTVFFIGTVVGITITLELLKRKNENEFTYESKNG